MSMLSDETVIPDGNEVYRTRIVPLLRPEDMDKFVVLDPASGDYEIDADELTAMLRLRSRHPQGIFRIERAGHEAAHLIRTLA